MQGQRLQAGVKGSVSPPLCWALHKVANSHESDLQNLRRTLQEPGVVRQSLSKVAHQELQAGCRRENKVERRNEQAWHNRTSGLAYSQVLAPAEEYPAAHHRAMQARYEVNPSQERKETQR